MIIREATKDDAEAIVQLGLAFAYEFPAYFAIPIIPSDAQATVIGLVDSPVGYIAVAEADHKTIVGTIMLVAQPTFYNLRQSYVQELLFYVLPEYRRSTCGTLMKARAEEWAKYIGAYGIGFGWLPGTVLKESYLSYGYVERELHLSKVF